MNIFEFCKSLNIQPGQVRYVAVRSDGTCIEVIEALTKEYLPHLQYFRCNIFDGKINVEPVNS